MRISVEWMKEQGAPPADIAYYANIFGESAELTREGLLEAAEAGLKWWLVAAIIHESSSRPAALRVFKEAANRASLDRNKALESARRRYLGLDRDGGVAEEAKADQLAAYRDYLETTQAAYLTYAQAEAAALADLLNLP